MPRRLIIVFSVGLLFLSGFAVFLLAIPSAKVKAEFLRYDGVAILVVLGLYFVRACFFGLLDGV